jgi:hypothetical protein
VNEGRTIAATAKSRALPRRAMALLVCLLVMTLASSSLVGILGAMTADLAALRNTTDYERALYLAGAGAHHALAELEADASWTTGISNTPSTGTQYYSATVATQGDGSVIITGIGVSGSVTRRVAVTVDFGD